MQFAAAQPQAPTAIRTHLGAIFVSLELSRSTWLITSLSPDGGEKLSKHSVRGSDVAGLLERFARLKEKARARTGEVFPIIVIQEAGLDGFWIHRVLQSEGIESHVVDPASVATSRRRRRAKTDRIDGEALVRALLAYKRGEPRVCAMVKAPTPQEEDRRRVCRERKVLIVERVQHVNRVKGLLFCQGITGYKPLQRDRRERLEELQTGDSRPLPDHLKAQLRRELDRIELLMEHLNGTDGTLGVHAFMVKPTRAFSFNQDQRLSRKKKPMAKKSVNRKHKPAQLNDRKARNGTGGELHQVAGSFIAVGGAKDTSKFVQECRKLRFWDRPGT